MFIGISPALAAPAAQGFDIMSLLPFFFIFVVFYFLLIRPQQKRVKAHQEMLSQVRRGDKVLTTGGILATVHRVVDDKELVLEIAEDVQVRAVRSAISDVIKTEK